MTTVQTFIDTKKIIKSKKNKMTCWFYKNKKQFNNTNINKKIESMKFLHKRKISKFDHSNCSHRIDEQTLKYIIINCVLIFDTFNIWLMIENNEKKIYEKLMFYFKTTKILIWWFIKSDLLSMFFFCQNSVLLKFSIIDATSSM